MFGKDTLADTRSTPFRIAIAIYRAFIPGSPQPVYYFQIAELAFDRSTVSGQCWKGGNGGRAWIGD